MATEILKDCVAYIGSSFADSKTENPIYPQDDEIIHPSRVVLEHRVNVTIWSTKVTY